MSTSAVPTFAQAEFCKASLSEPNGNCVQVARRDGWVAVRDDKTDFGSDDDHRLVLPAHEFDRALAAWRTGTVGPVQITEPSDSYSGRLIMRLGDSSGPDLMFSPDEIDAFLDGVARGEFNVRA